MQCLSVQRSGDAENTPPTTVAAGSGIARLSNFLKSRAGGGKKRGGQSSASKKCKNDLDHQQHGSGECEDDAQRRVQPVKAKLDISFEQLMKMVTKKSDETALSPDEECLICVTRRACIQSYPCGHKVLCEKCFVKLLQINYSEGKYPVTCVFCRSPVALYRRQDPPTVVVKRYMDTPGLKPLHANGSMTSGPLPSISVKRPGYL